MSHAEAQVEEAATVLSGTIHKLGQQPKGEGSLKNTYLTRGLQMSIVNPYNYFIGQLIA